MPGSIAVTLICNDSALSALLVQQWHETGTSLSQVLVQGPVARGRLKPWQALQRAGVSITVLAHPADWSGLLAGDEGARPPLLVCYGFMREIPLSFLDGFAWGGWNIHPSCLPLYPGPQPSNCMIADGMLDKSAALSLHEMVAGFDTGPLLGQARLKPADYVSIERYQNVVVATALQMLRDVIAQKLNGQAPAWPQPAGPRNWARYAARSMLLCASSTADEVRAALAFLPGRKVIWPAAVGKRASRVIGCAAVLGPPTGRPMRHRLHCVEWDCADARLRLVRATLAGRLYRKWLKLNGRWLLAAQGDAVRPWGPPDWTIS